jgi:hypothetical protein
MRCINSENPPKQVSTRKSTRKNKQESTSTQNVVASSKPLASKNTNVSSNKKQRVNTPIPSISPDTAPFIHPPNIPPAPLSVISSQYPGLDTLTTSQSNLAPAPLQNPAPGPLALHPSLPATVPYTPFRYSNPTPPSESFIPLVNPSLTTPNNTLGLLNHASASSQLSQAQPVTGLVYMPGCYDDENNEDYQTDKPNNLTATNCVAFGDQDIENNEDDYDEERVSSVEKGNSSVSLILIS